RVVLAVIGDPRDHRPLDRGRAEDREDGAQHGPRLEAAVGEQPVVADGHAASPRASTGTPVTRPVNVLCRFSWTTGSTSAGPGAARIRTASGEVMGTS